MPPLLPRTRFLSIHQLPNVGRNRKRNTLIRYPSTQASSYAHGVDKRGPQGQIRPGAEIANRPEYVKRGDSNCACVLGCSVFSVNAMLSDNLDLPGETSRYDI